MKNLLLPLFSFISIIGFSQNEEDALRFSQSYFGGTARNISMAGAMTALGGDYSSTSQNPASMGRFNKNNIVFTPIYERARNTSSFYGNTSGKQASILKVGNLSYLKSYKLPKESSKGWTTLQLGIGYNRINSFENERKYSGEIDSSILHNFINEANGTSTENIYNYHPWGAGLAYDTYAIDPATNNTYTTSFNSGNSIHDRTINSSGAMGEYSAAISGNYQNKFYLGGTANIIRAKYRTNYTHKETFTAQDTIWLNGIEYLGNLSTMGYGANVKIGAIYLPTKNTRIGLAVHSPTFFKMKDEWGNDMSSNTDDTTNAIYTIASENKPTGEYDYKINTPFKANLSLAYVIKKLGSIAAEIEYIDYSTSKLKAIPFGEAYYSFDGENTQIKNIYRPRFNFKIGGEYRINPMLYLRAGYAYYSSPFSKESGVNTSPTQFITGGLGLNFGDYYFDFAVAQKRVSYNYYAYNPDLRGSTSYFTENNINVSASIGFRFK
jgi:long-subunit fatty acid transport protein